MKQYIVDAFTDKVFSGNPAAVCVLEMWLPDDLMLKIAKENNLSETAFAVKEETGYHLRWFTPAGEIDLCGHATLATGYVLLRFFEPEADEIRFKSMSGELRVKRHELGYEMIFPVYEYKEIPVTDLMEQAFGARPAEAVLSRDLLAVFESEDIIRNMKPDQEKLKLLNGLCIGVTARGTEYDCVSRVFAPELSLPEDPVTGSTHCLITPYWAKRLGKNEILAFQASWRTGILRCILEGDKVHLVGNAALYAIADILPELPE